MAKRPATTATADEPYSIFSLKNSCLPEDTVFYAIFPDFSLPANSPNPNSTAAQLTSELQALHLQIVDSVSSYTSEYIWQHEPFTLSVSNSSCICSSSSSQVPHLHGKVRFGDNLEDEWFVVFLLYEISRRFRNVSVRVWDTDGEFLLIEAAFYLPRWIDPENSENRVFVRNGELCIVPRDKLQNPSLVEALSFLVRHEETCRAAEKVQVAVGNRIREYPERARRNLHCVRVRVPVAVAQVFRHEPCFVSLAVEGFYDRDIDTMKYAAKMERFLPKGKEEELVLVGVRMSRAMYAQLLQQTFQAPKCYPMPSRSDGAAYAEAELGMKIACGFEMMYQLRRKGGMEGKGSSWDAYLESLGRSGYFEGLLPGSQEYKRLMENAEAYYRNSSLFSRASEMMNAPVRRIDEILALPCSVDDFRGTDVPPSDEDSWLYNGEDELNAALLEREKEMEIYNKETKMKEKTKDSQEGGTSGSNANDFDLSNIAKTMQAFVEKVSTYKGAEIPEKSNVDEVDFDVDRFMKDMESVMGNSASNPQDDAEDDSSSDIDFDDSDEEIAEDKEGEDSFMQSYADALDEELKKSTLEKSFIRADQDPEISNKATSSNQTEDMDVDFTPVDVDVNLVKSILDSISSQQGLPGPASNLLELMGIQLPPDAGKGK
uniref:Protein ecdysoneless homolog n=1 Tax=Kalanchoe fedtschenkoi TaxID=63787 RepID=A0A7N0TTW0_KALFE